MAGILDVVERLYQQAGWESEYVEEADSQERVRRKLRVLRPGPPGTQFVCDAEEVPWPRQQCTTFQFKAICPFAVSADHPAINDFLTRQNFCQTLGYFSLAHGLPLEWLACLPTVDVPSRTVLWLVICQGVHQMQRCLWVLKGMFEHDMNPLTASTFAHQVGPQAKDLAAMEALLGPEPSDPVRQLAAWLKARKLSYNLHKNPSGDYELGFLYKTHRLTFRCQISEEAAVHRPADTTGRFISFFTSVATGAEPDPLVPPPDRKVAALEFLNQAHHRMRYGVFTIWWHPPTVCKSYVTHSLQYPLMESSTADRMADLFLAYWCEFTLYLEGYLAVVRDGAEPAAGLECVYQARKAAAEPTV